MVPNGHGSKKRFKTPKKSRDTADCIRAQKIYSQLPQQLIDLCTQDSWPTIEKLNSLLFTIGYRFEDQQVLEQESDTFNYEQSIYVSGRNPTRVPADGEETGVWHDLFNAFIWITYPEIKKVMNRLQYTDQQKIGFQERTGRQNAGAHFDECGVVVIVPSVKVLEMWGHM